MIVIIQPYDLDIYTVEETKLPAIERLQDVTNWMWTDIYPQRNNFVLVTV